MYKKIYKIGGNSMAKEITSNYEMACLKWKEVLSSYGKWGNNRNGG